MTITEKNNAKLTPLVRFFFGFFFGFSLVFGFHELFEIRRERWLFM